MENFEIYETIGSVVALGAMAPFLARKLADKDIIWTTMETGDIKFIVHGETLSRVICDIPGFDVDENDGWRIKETKEKPKKPPFGLYRVGIPGLSSIHNFTITKDKENPDGTTKDDWIIKGDPVKVFSLRFTFPRPYVFPKIELRGEKPVAFDLFISARFQVVDPVKMVFGLKGKFFENAYGILKAGIGDIVNDYTPESFLSKDKGEGEDSMFSPLKGESPFNKALIEQTGMRLVGISVDADPTNKGLRDAMEAEEIAKLNGLATKATSDANLYATNNQAEGEKALRKAKISATVEAFGSVEAAQNLLGKEAQPNVLVISNGTTTPPIILNGGNK